MRVLNSTANASSPEMDFVYNIAQGTLVGLGLPMGIIYDVLGPSLVALLGGSLSGVGLAAMAWAIHVPSANWWLYWAYPLAVASGGLASYSLLGFMWLFPAQQIFVGSLTVASAAVSDSLALVGVRLHSLYGVPLPVFFLGLAVIAVVAGIAAFCMAPSKGENHQHYAYANGMDRDVVDNNNGDNGDDRGDDADDAVADSDDSGTGAGAERMTRKKKKKQRSGCGGTGCNVVRNTCQMVRYSILVVRRWPCVCVIFQVRSFVCV